jgi:predicted protein tyrosine phosphatase
MIEVHPGLFVGPQEEYESSIRPQSGWAIVHACKEPYHRQALGYVTFNPKRDHPEYFAARRAHRLCLNLIDGPDPDDIPAQAINEAVAFIHEHLQAGDRVFLHCQMGMSRSPGIAMLYLGTHTDRLPSSSFEAALARFCLVYPLFSPRPGILGFLRSRWESGLRSPIAGSRSGHGRTGDDLK